MERILPLFWASTRARQAPRRPSFPPKGAWSRTLSKLVCVAKSPWNSNLQINVINPRSILDTGFDGLLGFVVRHVSSGDLGRVEDLGAINPRLANGVGAFRFVGVVFCAIDL